MDNPESKPTITRAEIAEGLCQLGLTRGDIVEVHSSLSSLGWVEGGADAVIEALMDVVTAEGAIVMTAQPVGPLLPLTDEDRARGVTAKVHVYDVSYEGPTNIGRIADTFRLRDDTILGPTFHRVCAWGRDAVALSAGYQELLKRDGWALMLGVPIGYCSSMHQAEHVGIPDEVAACYRIPDEIRQAYPDDIHISWGSTPQDGWEAVREMAEARGLIRRGQIGEADCMLFKARDVVEIYEHALRTDPLSLWGLS